MMTFEWMWTISFLGGNQSEEDPLRVRHSRTVPMKYSQKLSSLNY